MSNPQSMQQLADKFMNDAEFREGMRRDPVGATTRRPPWSVARHLLGPVAHQDKMAPLCQ